MTDNPGRTAFLSAATLFDDLLVNSAPPADRAASLRWAREQIRLQAIQHIRTHPGGADRSFVTAAAAALMSIDEVLAGHPLERKQ